MSKHSGIYTMEEFTDREVLRLAPDSFVTIMGRTGTRVLVNTDSVTGSTTHQKMNFKSGLLSINVNNAVQPGSGNCAITYVCPQYNSLDTNFYITQPNGVKVPFFSSMMEVRVYSKGRFLHSKGMPVYYSTFWGFVQSVDEAPNGNETTFTLNCRDMLGWWEYQYMNVVPAATQIPFGSPAPSDAGSLFRYMNPWEIILNLFKLTGFESFVYPGFDKDAKIPPKFADYIRADGGDKNGGYAIAAGAVIKNWKTRYGFGDNIKDKNRQYMSNLEMFGVSGKIDLTDNNTSPFKLVKNDAASIDNGRRESFKTTNTNYDTTSENNKQSNRVGSDAERAQADSDASSESGDLVYQVKRNQGLEQEVTVEFDILGKVMPFANFSEYTPTTSPVKMTKLEIAAMVSDQVQFEFFQDTNGMFVFKPPFYNMDVSRHPVYTIKAEDILSFSQVEDSTQVTTFVTATGPILYTGTTTPYQAVHVDFGLLDKYGIREKTVNLAFGNNPETIQAMAASEMAKMNANAWTASVTIPHRPELRLGYPVYIDHIDTFYYVKSIAHSTSFGTTATTTLTLSARRSRVYDSEGNLQCGYIYATLNSDRLSKELSSDEKRKNAVRNLINGSDAKKAIGALEGVLEAEKQTAHKSVQQSYSGEMSPTDKYMVQNNLVSSPSPGFYRPVQSPKFRSLSTSTSDAVSKTRPLNSGILTELYHFTKDSVPYTDVNGFQHIGGFPYGATLVLTDDNSLLDATTVYSSSVKGVASQISTIAPSEPVVVAPAGTTAGSPPTGTSSDAVALTESAGKAAKEVLSMVTALNSIGA